MERTKERVLESTYLEHWDYLTEAIQQSGVSISELSMPWLIDVVPGYIEDKHKVLIVGKESNGWEKYSDLLTVEKEEAVRKLQNMYLQFRQDNKWAHAPFWKGAHEIHKALNPDSPDYTFMTTNLIRIDQNNTRPSKSVEEAVCSSFLVLHSEIEMLEPDVMIFFTGPYYDERIRQTFEGVSFEMVDGFDPRILAQLKHDKLPIHTYRTYHPGFSLRNRARYFEPVLEFLQRSLLK
ncbi:hypothetical protein ACFQPF_06730 [Fictibacillus iocasae]|uniref:Uracil-DNA glycosylase-like domain-containing protein n=1 Tax=Fictibacillus iocasae TaxID=2715437 RepID=A0ABW2NTK0_9BACL